MLKRIIKNLSISSKIQAIILTSIIMITISAFISIYFISETHKEVLYNTLTSYLSYSGADLAKNFDSIDTIADNVFSNSTVQDCLYLNKHSTQKSEKRYCQTTIYSVLSDYIFDFGNIGVSYIAIYQDDDLFTSSLTSTSEVPEEVLDHLIQEGNAAAGASKWVINYCDEYGLFLVKEIYRTDNLSLENLGVMIININLETLISATSIFELDYEKTAYILYYDDFLMTYSDTITVDDAALMIQETPEHYKIISLNSETLFNVFGKIPGYEWNIIISVSYNSITEALSITQILWIFILISCIVIAMLLSTTLVKNLVRHLSLLVTKMRQFGNNSYAPENFEPIYKQREDEIGLLHNTFDSMVAEIDSLIEKDYKNELLNKEAQIKAMESQMDPHFLYNTLDSLNWTAKSLGASTISEVTIALANLLRVTLSSDTTHFTLQQEITTLNYYFTIQKMRYQKRLDYQINIPEDLWIYEIPKLTLQPLVENSIRYGFESIIDICHITINSRSEGQNIYIEVKNNGSSFEEDMLEKLLSNEIVPNGFGVGISNIHKRLQLTYGIEYGLTLLNQNNPLTGEEYAVVQIKIPKTIT